MNLHTLAVYIPGKQVGGPSYSGSTGNTAVHNPALGSFLGTLDPSSSLAYFQMMLPNLIGLLFIIGAIVFLFIMLMGGIQWISSGGDKAALESARGKITNAIIGLVILLGTFAIIKLIETFFWYQHFNP